MSHKPSSQPRHSDPHAASASVSDTYRDNTADVVSPWLNSPVRKVINQATAAVFLVATLPITATVAALVALDGESVFFTQKRLGKDNKEFNVYKFRTLKEEHGDVTGRAVVKDEDRHRFTWIGDFLRKSKIDEFPQALNIMLGDMTWLGPRAMVAPHVAEKFSPGHGQYRARITSGFSILGTTETREWRDHGPCPNAERAEAAFIKNANAWTEIEHAVAVAGHITLDVGRKLKGSIERRLPHRTMT